MGLLVNGEWVDQWYDTKKHGGEFVRESAQLRDWWAVVKSRKATVIRPSGSLPPLCIARLPLGAPCADHAQLKGLEPLIGTSHVSPLMLGNGWHTIKQRQRRSINHAEFHHQLYTMTNPTYTGRVTVPVLWINSAARLSITNPLICCVFNRAFDELTGNNLDFYPEDLRSVIDEVNDDVYDHINNGVYKSGFATEQQVYEKHVTALFDALERMRRTGRASLPRGSGSPKRIFASSQR